MAIQAKTRMQKQPKVLLLKGVTEACEAADDRVATVYYRRQQAAWVP